MKSEPLFLRPDQVAAILQVSRSKVYTLIADGTLPSMRFGGSIRVPMIGLHELARKALNMREGKKRP